MSRELDEFLRQQEQAPQAAARARVDAARQQQPAQAAEISQASRGLGVPATVVAAAPDVYREQVNRIDDDLAVARSSPLAQWLAQNETNAPVARGAFSGLARMHDEIAAIGAEKPKNTPDRIRSALKPFGLAGTVAYDSALYAKDTVGAFLSGDVTLRKAGNALLSGVSSAAVGVASGVEATARVLDDYTPIAMAERALFGQSLAGAIAVKARTQAEGWDKVAKYLHPETQTEQGAGVISGLESLPLSVGGLLGGAYFRSARIATGVVSAIVGGQSYRTGIDEGMSNERAILYGGTDALIEYATEILPTKSILKSIGAKGRLTSNLADLLVSEIPGEQLATLGQDFNQWFSIDENKGKTFGAFLAERPAAARQTLLATLIGAGTVTSAVSALEFAAAKLGRDLPRALPAQDNARFLDALGRLSAANQVLQRDKGTFEDWIRTAADGTAATDVFIDAEQIAQIFEQGNIEPEQAFAITGMSPEELQLAVQRGDTISIPIEKYASEIAPTPLSAQLIPHMRIDPEDMSIEEAKVFLQSAKDEFAKDVEDTFAKSQQADVLRASHDVVKENLAAQLNGIGRFSSSVVDQYAGLTAAFYTTLATRGITLQDGTKIDTAEKAAALFPLRVQSGEMAQPTFDQQQTPPLRGLPKTSRGVFEPAQRAAEVHAAAMGMEYSPPRVYSPVDVSRAARIAQAFEEMQHDPTNPEVRAAYDAMIAETLAQWQVIKGTGLQVEFVVGEDPYGGNPFGAVDDVRENNHIWVFNTEDGYGQNGITPAEEAVNPMLAIVPNEIWSGRPVRVNDVFRVVHDYFGHIKDGVGFRAAGEENAWRSHAAMYSPLARKAMTTETRGQNSWLNFGPHGETNRTARVEDTIFADQKIGLLPDWVSEEGAGDPETFDQSAAVLQLVPLQIKGSGPGGRVLNWDLAEALDMRHMLRYGRALDPSDPADYAVAREALLEDYVDQVRQADDGLAWYSDDIAAAIEATTLILPELAEPVRRDIFLTVAAILSPQQGPIDNWGNAIHAMTGYSNTGRFALAKPSGANFGVASHASGLRLFQHLIETEGEIGALIWINSEHTGREMEAVRRASGIFSNKADNYLPSEMNLTESKLGAYMFGPKVGDFMLNSTGLDQNAVTVDLWMARTYNRIIGRLTDVNAKDKEFGKLADAMRGKGERVIMKNLVRDVAKEAGIAPSAMQAALWYFEQRLYRRHGIQSGSTSFSDAANFALEERGIAPPDRTATGGRAPRDAAAEEFDAGENVRVFDQSPIENPLVAFRRESFYPTRATRLEDGTVLAGGVPNWYPDRLAKLADQLGATKVEGVEKDDPRLDTGVPLWFTAPPIEADGMIRLDHWGPRGITTTDPTMWGASKTLPPAERQRVGVALPRTYFGIASGLPGGYVIEFPTMTQYEVRVDPASLYDVASDPDGLKQGDGVSGLERRIKAAGYIGYWSNNEQLGLVATVFDPLPVQPASARVFHQDAVFYSALERAIENSSTTKAPAAQWAATLQKTPGVKQEELEWTGLLDFLADVEGPVTREAILELVRSGGIKVDEVVQGAAVVPQKRDFDSEEDWVAAREEYRAMLDDSPGTQFSTWTTDPENPSYRELLITLPLGQAGNPNRAASTHWDIDGVVAHARFMDKTDADGKRVLFIEEVQSDWHQKGRDQGYATPVDPAKVAAAEAAQTAAAKRVAELTDVLGLQMQAEYDRYLASAFKNGGEELRARQEDDYGHLAPRDGVISINKAVRFLREFPSQDLIDENTVREFEVARLRYNEAAQELARATSTQGIPNAPFKTTWPALVMKRMIRYAAEHGYERVAWTTGKQQSERYNLSQNVGSLDIHVDTTEAGMASEQAGSRRYTVIVQMDRAARVIRDSYPNIATQGENAFHMTKEQMAEVFGRDIAEKGSAQADAAPQRTAFNGEAYYSDVTLSGAELNVGGEGMRAFYDRNLVNITNNLIKKHGAKVGTVTLEDPTRADRIARLEQAVAVDRGALALLNDPEQVRQGQERGQSSLWFQTPEKQMEKIRRAEERLAAARAETGPQQPGFDVTPSLADAAMGGQPLFQKTGAPRGQIAFGADITKTESVITVLRGADLSTFVHELGHFFFEVTNHIASQAGAPQSVIDDRDTMLRYLGVRSATEWENSTPAARREGHERMARSFEAYLFEGNAPSAELRGIFKNLRQWMINVYRTITRLNVALTDEVRSAFDRMLASEEQIRDNEADAGMKPQFTEKPEGMSDADWADYQQLGTDATAEAAEALSRRSLRDMRYAGKSVAREIKRLQAEMKERRDAMREEVVADLSAKPIYQAMQFLRKGTIGDSPPEEFHKLDTAIVREVLQLDPDMPLPASLKGMTSSTNGVNPEQVAELFGYSSADHLIKDLLFASSFKDAVEAETDARMRERYGEVASPDQLDEAARAAIHNDVRGRFVATELAALQNAPGKKRVLDGAARRLAAGMIAKLRIRDLRPSQFENAERKAAKAAQKAGTANLDEAVRQKRNQLFQLHAAKAAHEAVEETRKARDYLTKFGNKNTRAALDVDYLDQIDQLLERFELRQISNKEADRRKSLADWIKQQEDMGFEPTLDPEFLDEVGRKPWRDLTVEEMRELVDAIKNIEFLARVTKKLMTAVDKANLDDAAGQVAQSIRDNALSSRDEIVGNKTWLEGIKNGVRDFFAMHRKMANLLFVFDGNKLGGPAWERFMRGANRAGDTETQALRDAGSVLEPLFRQLGNTLRREYIPEIQRSLNLQDRLMIALNWGNATNRARVMDGDKWTFEQVEKILEPLTSEHWDFVEAIWAHINSYRQQIIDKERRVSGVVPKMVEAEPFQVAMPDGSLRLISGGYFPIKYDPDRSSKAEADTAADIAKQMQRGLYTRATTRRGHLKERVETVANRPIRKDFGVIFEHNSQVIHDLAWHEYLIDANRLLRHGAVDSAIREHYGPETLRWMRKAIEDMASGDVPAQNSIERGVNYLRSGATVAGLGWNLFTSLLQPVGLTQSWSRIGVKWVGRGIGELLGDPIKMNEKVQWIYSVSPFMRARGDTMQREINEIRNTLAAKGPVRSTLDKITSPEINDAISDSFFVMIAKAQLMADLPTWLGQYHKSLDSGESEERAIELANQSVIDSQGSGMIKDLAGVQRGGPLWKLWTNFYSYFSVTYNLLVDRTTQLRRVGPKDLPFFAGDVLLLTVVPATLTAIMRAILKGDDPDEPEDWASLIAKENLSYMLGLVLGLREVGAAVTGNAGYRGPAGARIIGDLSNLGKQVAQGEADEAALRAANNVAGVLLHYPAGQVDRTARGLYYLSKGEAGIMAPIVGPPADVGK